MEYKNRWFTKTGKRKRVPARLEPWRPFVEKNKENFIKGNLTLVTKGVMEQENCSLVNATNMMVALFGIFDNAKYSRPGLFRVERYEAGYKLLIGKGETQCQN